MRILIIEDDMKLAVRLKNFLEKDGHVIHTITEGSKSVTCSNLHRHEYNFIILDPSLPGKEGFDVCMEIRICGIKAPILLLATRDDEEYKKMSEDCGADDYLTKPFSTEELREKIKNILDRQNKANKVQQINNVRLDQKSRTLFLKDKEVSLTAKELNILEYFMQHPHEVLNREQISDSVWGLSPKSVSNVVDVHIKNLRKKITRDKNMPVIETVWGFGYRFNVSNLI